MKTTFTNIMLVIVAFLIPMGVIQAQHMKVMPDGVVIPKGDHTVVVFPENGQMLYDTVSNSVWFYNNSIWLEGVLIIWERT